MSLDHPKHLNKDAKLLLMISSLFTLANALSSTFVNVYLWKLKQDFLLIGWFNLYQFLAMMITFIIAGKLAKKVDRILILRLGVTILAIFYLVVLLFNKHATDYFSVLGWILGIGQGFYWFAYNILYFEITEPENRDIFNGMNGLVTSFGGMLAPLLSGWFLSKQVGTYGYQKIFFISLIVFFVAVLLSFWFYKRKSEGQYMFKEVIRQTVHQHNWRHIFFAMVAQGGREGAIVFLIGLLIYISTGNEFSLGTYTAIISGVSLITYYLVGRWIKKNWRRTAMVIGSLMMSIVLLPLFFKTSYTTLMIYGVGTSIFAPLYFIPLTTVVFDVIGENEKSASMRGEYIVIREIGLNVGRILTIIIYLLLIKWIGKEAIRYLLLISGSLPILAMLMMRQVKYYT